MAEPTIISVNVPNWTSIIIIVTVTYLVAAALYKSFGKPKQQS